MKKFFKGIGIGTAICTAVGAGVVVVKMIVDKVNGNNEDVVEDEEPEFEDSETDKDSETTDESTNTATEN